MKLETSLVFSVITTLAWMSYSSTSKKIACIKPKKKELLVEEAQLLFVASNPVISQAWGDGEREGNKIKD